MPPPQANRTGERDRPRPPDVSGTGAGAPETIGRYRLLDKIAKGGMAEVFAARSYGAHGFEKTVALKRILPKFGRDPQFVRMMVDEAKISVLLNHPNIAQVFELGEQDGDYFIVMEFVPGQSLASLVKRLKEDNGRVPVLEACFIVVELLQGLHAAHIQRDANGEPAHIIHRDVSPQNTLVSFDGHVKVIDFGIARARDRLEATEIGTIKGKLRYLAPEMIDPGRFTREGDFDHRVDVFAAGIVLWELLAGRPLFPGDDEMKVYDDITDGVTPDLVKEGRCDPALMKIVHKALERRLERRYEDAESFADDLRAYVYRTDPAFTHKRVAAVLDKLFPEEKAFALALERGGAPSTMQSGSVPRVQPPAAGVNVKPLPPTAPEHHTRSDRQLPSGPRGGNDAATAIADMGALDGRGDLGAQREVTVMTLVSREGVLGGLKPPSDNSGVFSGVDDATLTVAADALVAGLKGTVSARAPSSPPTAPSPLSAPAPSTTPPRVTGERGPVRPARPPRGDETPLTARQPAPPAPAADGSRNRLIAASAVVGIVVALGIVAVLDRVGSGTTPPAPAPTVTTTPTVARTTLTVTSMTPGAIVEVAGQRGPAPFVADVEVGATVDVIVSADGMTSDRRSLTIGEGPQTLEVALQAARVPLLLELEPPSAVVSINGGPVAEDGAVAPGPVEVTVSAPGHFAITQQLVAVAGVPLRVATTLKPVDADLAPSPPPAPAPAPTHRPKPAPAVAVGKGTLTVKSTPLWGKVTIDGKTYEDTTPLTVSLPAGKHDVVVAHPPRNLTKRAKVTVEADKTTVHTVTFE